MIFCHLPRVTSTEKRMMASHNLPACSFNKAFMLSVKTTFPLDVVILEISAMKTVGLLSRKLDFLDGSRTHVLTDGAGVGFVASSYLYN